MAGNPGVPIKLDHIEDKLKITLYETKPGSLIDAGFDAAEHGEAQYQMKEGYTYQYGFSSEDFMFGPYGENIIQPMKSHPHLGVISPNIFVGTLNLPIHRKSDGAEVGHLPLEVRSKKTGYRGDYRTMLEFITEKCVDLILQSESVVAQNLTSDFSKDASDVLYQRFMFVKAVVGSEEFEEAVLRVLSAPVTQWADKIELRDIRQAGRFSPTNIREILKRTNRVPVPKGHPLRDIGLDSIPDRISVTLKTDTVNTAENRFVKHALESFLKFCEDVEAARNAGATTKAEARRLAERIEGWLQHDVFRSQSRATLLKLNSPVLQRKAGYREVLKVWLMFDLAAKLIWSAGDDVYSAGKKDVATLYEYWLFFMLLELIRSIYQIEPQELDQLIRPSSDGMTLSLRQGDFIALNGTTEKNGRKLSIRFSYNRSFTGKSDYLDSGSWTSTLRPDYTLSIWPFGVNADEAEKQELIVHVHFDAKYRVDVDYKSMMESSANADPDEKKEFRRGNVKNADLLKMHAYKDAIRRTGGAYVLYPGDGKPVKPSAFHEIVPGLGAFSIRPKPEDTGIEELRAFLVEITDHFVNRTSRREKQAYQTYRIQDPKWRNDFTISEALPEVYDDNRGLIPDETYVLVGFYKDTAHRAWIKKHGLYNFRTGSERGSLVLDPKTVGARYLLLHTRGDDESGDLLKVTSAGPKVFSAEDMIKRAYPNQAPHPHYLVLNVSNVVEKELLGKSWNFKNLPGYETGRASAEPFAVSLAELMRYQI